MLRILLVEGDPDLRHIAREALQEAGFELHEAEGVAGARAVLAPGGPDIDCILLEVVLPGVSGWEFLSELRDKSEQIPVLIVSALGSLRDRVRGLRMGADDYLVKPVEFEELAARVEAVQRRRRALSSIRFADVILDLSRRRVVRAGNPMKLSPREYDLLLALVRGAGQVVSRRTLLRDVWDLGSDQGTNVLDVHVGRLRKKLNLHGPPLIRTVRGAGYRMVDVRQSARRDAREGEVVDEKKLDSGPTSRLRM
jgi:two-component system OmpR family response regulator